MKSTLKFENWKELDNYWMIMITFIIILIMFRYTLPAVRINP